MASSSPSTPKRRTMKDLKTPTKRRMFLPSPGTPTTFKSGRKSTVQNHIDTLYTSVSSDLPPLLSTENHNIIMLHAYLGFQTLLVFLSALVHVPSTFPSRMNYVMNIINQFSGKVFSLLEITEITDIIGTCATSKSFMELNLLDLTDVLWDTSLTNKEPYLQFIVPPVKNSCIRKECDGKIYPYSKSFVTLFTSNGPMPGQKAVLRCRQCQTYYHIDNYQIPNRGKQFYPPDIHQDWKCASNRVYFSKDLHELMCESGEASFKAGDLHTPKVFQGALNRTFDHGNLLCIFKQGDLVPLVADLARQARQLQARGRKKMVANAGLQPDGIHVMLNPNQIFDIRSSAMVNPNICPYVWLTDVCLGGPREELTRTMVTPPSIQPLTDFLYTAATIFDNNFGAAVLAWSTMYSMNVYQKLLADVRHFNLPVLYGLPTVGKTLIAQCGAWLNGCSDFHIASRCTLAFVTSWLTNSSLPFVWDDPASSDEVAQLAVDLANGAVRGKSGEDVKTPLSGCLVTANFDLSVLYKSFSRLVVFPVNTLNRQKQTGDARVVEDEAHRASSALPIIVGEINKIMIEDVAAEVTNLNLEADIRVAEGIAIPVLIARVILNLAGCYALMPKVIEYVEGSLKPYYREALEVAAEPMEMPMANVGDSFIRKIMAVIQHNRINGACTIVKDAVAIRKDRLQFLSAKVLRREVLERAGKTSHTVRLAGRPTKCIWLPADAFGELWQVVKTALDEDEPEIEEPVPEPLAPAVNQQQDEQANQLPAPAVNQQQDEQANEPPAPDVNQQQDEQANEPPAPAVNQQQDEQANEPPAPAVNQQQDEQANEPPAPAVNQQQDEQANEPPAPAVNQQQDEQANEPPAPAVNQQQDEQANEPPAPAVNQQQDEQANEPPATAVNQQQDEQANQPPAPAVNQQQDEQANKPPAPAVNQQQDEQANEPPAPAVNQQQDEQANQPPAPAVNQQQDEQANEPPAPAVNQQQDEQANEPPASAVNQQQDEQANQPPAPAVNQQQDEQANKPPAPAVNQQQDEQANQPPAPAVNQQQDEQANQPPAPAVNQQQDEQANQPPAHAVNQQQDEQASQQQDQPLADNAPQPADHVPPPAADEDTRQPCHLLPFPTRKKPDAEKVPCGVCDTVGGRALIWIKCTDCDALVHRKCTTISAAIHRRRMKDNPEAVWSCGRC